MPYFCGEIAIMDRSQNYALPFIFALHFIYHFHFMKCKCNAISLVQQGFCIFPTTFTMPSRHPPASTRRGKGFMKAAMKQQQCNNKTINHEKTTRTRTTRTDTTTKLQQQQQQTQQQNYNATTTTTTDTTTDTTMTQQQQH